MTKEELALKKYEETIMAGSEEVVAALEEQIFKCIAEQGKREQYSFPIDLKDLSNFDGVFVEEKIRKNYPSLVSIKFYYDRTKDIMEDMFGYVINRRFDDTEDTNRKVVVKFNW